MEIVPASLSGYCFMRLGVLVKQRNNAVYSWPDFYTVRCIYLLFLFICLIVRNLKIKNSEIQYLDISATSLRYKRSHFDFKCQKLYFFYSRTTVSEGDVGRVFCLFTN